MSAKVTVDAIGQTSSILLTALQAGKWESVATIQLLRQGECV
eukprot:COSAG02_NODE_2007_length_10128_cov_5.313989_9_plen_42_part_00